MGLSIARAAKELGVAAPTLRRGIARGRLAKAVLADGTIDIREARREWVMNADPNKGEPGGRKPGTTTPNGVAASMHAAKAMRAAYDAKLTEMEYKRLIGALVPIEDVERATFEVGRRIRERLASIPARVAPVVAGLAGDQDACYRAVEAEVNQAMDDLDGLRVNGKAH